MIKQKQNRNRKKCLENNNITQHGTRIHQIAINKTTIFGSPTKEDDEKKHIHTHTQKIEEKKIVHR